MVSVRTGDINSLFSLYNTNHLDQALCELTVYVWTRFRCYAHVHKIDKIRIKFYYIFDERKLILIVT